MKKLAFLVAAFLLLLKGGSVYSSEMKPESMPGLQEKIDEFKKKQVMDNDEFIKTLKGIPDSERKVAIKEHREIQFNEREEFFRQMHEETMDYVNRKISSNPQINEEQRVEMLDFIEKQYQDNVAFRKQQFEDNTHILEQIVEDPKLSFDEKKKAIQEYYNAKKARRKEHREKLAEESKKLSQEMKK